MSTTHVTAAELRKLTPGSNARHEDLIEAALERLALARIPAVPIHTGPRVKPRPGGGWELYGQKRGQIGMGDILACLPPSGRLLLIDGKTGRAQLSRPQRDLRDRFVRAGGIYLVLRELAQLEPYIREVAVRSAFANVLGGGAPRQLSGVRPTGAASGPPSSVARQGGTR